MKDKKEKIRIFAKNVENLLNSSYEEIVFCKDEKIGFEAIIVIHNKKLGPALGGIRYYPYVSIQAALTDVVHLAGAMTLKSAIANLNLGGGKSVIIAKKNHDFQKICRRMGEFIESLAGKYYAAEDIGMDDNAMAYVADSTSFVTGKPKELGGVGNPAPFTAYSVYSGIKEALYTLEGTRNLSGVPILVEGLGQVGSHLLPYLIKEDAIVYVDEINTVRLNAMLKEYPEIKNSRQYKPKNIVVYSPCALGASVHPEKINALVPKIIAGAANNQLMHENYAAVLAKKDIIYVPDFLINAGGVINCAQEIYNTNHYEPSIVYQKIDALREKMSAVVEESFSNKESAHKIAEAIALQRLL